MVRSNTKRRKNKSKDDFFSSIDYSLLNSTTPVCSHFGKCGGCKFQNIEYKDELKLKQEFVKDNYASLYTSDIEVVPSPREYGYRNRVDFVYAFGNLGLRRKGTFKEVIDIDDCHLIPQNAREIFSKIRAFVKESNLKSYDYILHEGFFRYVVIRAGINTNELMLIFTTSKVTDDSEAKIMNELLDFSETLVSSVYWLINETITDISVPLEIKEVRGKTEIKETLGKISLNYSPFSFFQSNVKMAEIIFEEIKQEVGGSVIDVCCGVGAIALYVSENSRSITGIESIKEAIDMANENASLNDIKATFVNDDMKNLEKYAGLHVDTIIVDPPRSGLHSKTTSQILEIYPDKVIYLSCNPKTQVLDLKKFIEDNKYSIKKIKSFDMFPKTPHVEVLAILTKNNSF